MTAHRCIWNPPGSPFPAWTEHPDRDDAERLAEKLRANGCVDVEIVEVAQMFDSEEK